MTMEEFLYGKSRSTKHTTMVNRVKSHLKRICTHAGYEESLVNDRITDAFGHDEKSKTYYLCEIKVNFSDLQKAVFQIYDTAFRFKPKRKHIGSVVIPVIAIPVVLQRELVNYDNWNSLCDVCNKAGIAIWVIEQSAVRQIQGPKPKMTTKPKATTKAKATAGPKAATKTKAPTKAKAIAGPKAATKTKTTTKAKATARPKAATKSKTTTKAKAVKSTAREKLTAKGKPKKTR